MTRRGSPRPSISLMMYSAMTRVFEEKLFSVYLPKRLTFGEMLVKVRMALSALLVKTG